jgi:hypothetical protein
MSSEDRNDLQHPVRPAQRRDDTCPHATPVAQDAAGSRRLRGPRHLGRRGNHSDRRRRLCRRRRVLAPPASSTGHPHRRRRDRLPRLATVQELPAGPRPAAGLDGTAVARDRHRLPLRPGVWPTIRRLRRPSRHRRPRHRDRRLGGRAIPGQRHPDPWSPVCLHRARGGRLPRRQRHRAVPGTLGSDRLAVGDLPHAHDPVLRRPPPGRRAPEPPRLGRPSPPLRHPKPRLGADPRHEEGPQR